MALSSCDVVFARISLLILLNSLDLRNCYIFAINDVHAEIYSAVVYFSDSVLKYIFCGFMDTDLKLGKFHIPWDFRLSLDFFDSSLHTCTAVARLRWR